LRDVPRRQGVVAAELAILLTGLRAGGIDGQRQAVLVEAHAADSGRSNGLLLAGQLGRTGVPYLALAVILGRRGVEVTIRRIGHFFGSPSRRRVMRSDSSWATTWRSLISATTCSGALFRKFSLLSFFAALSSSF